MDRMYCTIQEMIDDLGLHGVKSEAKVMRYIRGASQEIDRDLGAFIPYTASCKVWVTGNDWTRLLVPPLLSVTSIDNDGTVLATTDWIGRPVQRAWEHGPYYYLDLDPDGSVAEWASDDLTIVGKWGMYDYSVSLGFSASLAAVDTATLAIADGSKLSPGMVLLIESEQLLVESTSTTTTDSTADLAEDVDATSETEITITDGTKVAVGEVIKVGFEQMLVLDIATNELQVERAYNGTSMAAHTSGAGVLVFRTFNVKRGINGTTAAIHSSKAVYQYQAPADVNYLCRQLAALMMNKASSNFVGRSGNDELGTGFWVNEFPKNQIETVKKNYFWGGA
jgi:hypothetical protein